ncbi:Subunit of heteropentameric Replication factor C (RF-C) [Tilletia horrida]|uniref:Subunit of heteropentameric Replication factor C (RF-C) n=1 Tax=Tilletia horrida TaxID=155126 RepID=A0AAN6GN49_9BASI|nr:Subunit of heteropentameric Replication factor C (RF-C) [Tilletia horrida]KAK0549068.1 Subunit of heteropentameric Replication factor C (RF-C) [Tilletia horrida]KAK0564651.1 Subunit of heteropentameric Replication factor C (RF-C) [Tilletia horrida]
MSNAFLQLGGNSAASAKRQAQAQDAARRAKVAESMRPWVEKYRPKSIDDVVAQEHTVNVLRRSLMSSNLPHMLFYGGPGTGKTSTILALARQLFGPELFRSRVLELNASDERGISVVREKIKNFAKLAVSTPQATLSADGSGTKKYPCPPFKIIILDEADSMTQDAQSALRRIMEQYSHITRFCLVCNYVTRIIEPLTSRCSKFRFRQLDTGSTKDRIKMIAEAEGVTFADEKVIDTLVQVSDGDLRRSITYLQSASRLHGASAAAAVGAPDEESVPRKASPITSASILEIAGRVPSASIRRFAAALGVDEYVDKDAPDEGGLNGDGDGDGDVAMADAEGNLARVKKTADSKTRPGSFLAVQREVALCTQSGYGATQIISQLHDYLMGHPTLNGTRKAAAAITLGLADKALVDGGDEELQLLNTGCQLVKDVK